MLKHGNKFALRNVMMTRNFLKTMIAVLMITLPLLSQEKQKDIVEEVGVNWWRVPVIAVDSSGNPVTDLEKTDIDVWLNQQKVTTFTLVKRSFNTTEHIEEPGEKAEPAKATGITTGQPAAGKPVVFLLLDLNLSDSIAIKRSKMIARDIVKDAAPGTRFVLMTIEPFAGLKVIDKLEDDGNRQRILDRIDQKITVRTNKRYVTGGEFTVKVGGRLTRQDNLFHQQQAASYYQRKNDSFFKAFKTLYLYLNGIEDSKFVYFLSEGMSNSMRYSIMGGISMYNKFMEKLGASLGRCGAVFVLVNPRGLDRDYDTDGSGESFLHFLSKESGGKYMEGTRTSIVKRINNIDRAFYEVFFPDLPESVTGSKDTTRKISIKSRRKGVGITSIRSIEKKKSYARMSKIEKELLAVNLVSGAPFLDRKMRVYNAAIRKVKEGKRKKVYHVQLPPGFVDKTLDVYKVRVAGEGEAAGVTGVKKESVKTKKDNLKVEFKTVVKKKGAADMAAYFVVVEPVSNSARVYGMGIYKEDPEIIEPLEKVLVKRENKPRHRETIAPGEMKRILAGAAGYCEKLKQSAFFFFCKESILESRFPLTTGSKNKDDITNATAKGISAYGPGNQSPLWTFLSKVPYSSVKKHRFTYRLLKKGTKVTEERQTIESPNKINKTDKSNQEETTDLEPEEVIKHTVFFPEKAVFAPITLLDRQRQDKYTYTFLRYDKWKGHPAAVINVVPKRPLMERASIYGDLWIDTEDFSVLKIQADPASILGYGGLKELAKKLRTRLELSLETQFNQINDGIRFPTQVRCLEKYKGGRIISRHRGPHGWERALTVFNYSDYQFFYVQMEVTTQ
ncbi:MAG: hypothetical protein GY940_16130 [bacterium]|nr:hypothetical protein [bacterium]